MSKTIGPRLSPWLSVGLIAVGVAIAIFAATRVPQYVNARGIALLLGLVLVVSVLGALSENA